MAFSESEKKRKSDFMVSNMQIHTFNVRNFSFIHFMTKIILMQIRGIFTSRLKPTVHPHVRLRM